VFSKEDTKWGQSRVWLYVFLAVPVISGILTWESPLSLLVIAATVVLTLALYSKDGKRMRRLFLLPPVLYISYNVAHKALGGIGSDVFCLISAIVAIYRFDIKKETTNH
ncbi:MAG: YgjV family protein, partial [Ruminiclostridium sp.]|nr:YgjV family protein [Ruminiclostridium sp.]